MYWDLLFDLDYSITMDCEDMIGKKVEKKSGKPFKSGLKVNTVKDIIIHPILLTEDAYTFVEDNSFVSVAQCRRNNAHT